MSAASTEPPNRRTLKANYLDCLRFRSPSTLRQAVQALVRTGVRRDLLLAWAVAKGHDKKYVAKVLSQCFCALGLRQRRHGAGRRTSPPALLLLAFAHEVFGSHQRKYLRAACRAASAPAAAELQATGLKVIPVPELYTAGVSRFGKKLNLLLQAKVKSRKKTI